MNRREAEQLARHLIAEHLGDGVRGSWEFAGFDRSVRRAGVARFFKLDGRGEISLSGVFVDRNGVEDVRDVVLHEVAHALAGHKAGHGAAWRVEARRIGARPERCYEVANVSMPEPPWKLTCECGRVDIQRFKRAMDLTGRRCRTCGPTLRWERAEIPTVQNS